MEQAVYGCGDFLAAQEYFDQIPGVISSRVGYSGGFLENPTHNDVLQPGSGHVQALHLEFDTTLITYEELLRHFFRLQAYYSAEGNDINNESRRPAIFYVNEQQKEMAEKVIESVQLSTEVAERILIEPLGPFYDAEEKYQKYAEKNHQQICPIRPNIQ